MSRVITPDEIMAETTLTILDASIEDQQNVPINTSGNFHRISDVALGVIEPIWALGGDADPDGPIGTLRDFDGTGYLEDEDILLEAQILAPSWTAATTSLYFDVDVPDAATSNGFWLPSAPPDLLPWLVPAVNTDARAVGESRATGDVRDYVIPADDAEIEIDKTVEFLFGIGTLYAATLIDPSDPRTVSPWSFGIRALNPQRGGVTILNNVIDPTGDDNQTALRVDLERGGLVVVQVFSLDGDLVKALHRGRLDAGSYTFTWDGTNSGGRVVARGLYFVRVVAPGVDEIRKVIVQKP
jgi:hypothetical protein